MAGTLYQLNRLIREIIFRRNTFTDGVRITKSEQGPGNVYLTGHGVSIIFCTTENNDYQQTAKSQGEIFHFHAPKINGLKRVLDLNFHQLKHDYFKNLPNPHGGFTGTQ